MALSPKSIFICLILVRCSHIKCTNVNNKWNEKTNKWDETPSKTEEKNNKLHINGTRIQILYKPPCLLRIHRTYTKKSKNVQKFTCKEEEEKLTTGDDMINRDFAEFFSSNIYLNVRFWVAKIIFQNILFCTCFIHFCIGKIIVHKREGK